MADLLNFLAGIGSAMTAFGTAPSYKIPSRKDRLNDTNRLRSDFRNVGRDLKKKTQAALAEERHGEVNDCSVTQ